MSVVTAHMVYFCAFARSEICQKNARNSGEGRGQFDAGVNGLRINFTSIFKVFTKLPESRSDKGNLENFENTSEINP